LDCQQAERTGTGQHSCALPSEIIGAPVHDWQPMQARCQRKALKAPDPIAASEPLAHEPHPRKRGSRSHVGGLPRAPSILGLRP
jgi:hypothetical protein